MNRGGLIILGILSLVSHLARADIYLGGGCVLSYPKMPSDPIWPGPVLTGCDGSSPGHIPSNAVLQAAPWAGPAGPINDAGGWSYHNDPRDPLFGQIRVNCGHGDMKRAPWLFE